MDDRAPTIATPWLQAASRSAAPLHIERKGLRGAERREGRRPAGCAPGDDSRAHGRSPCASAARRPQQGAAPTARAPGPPPPRPRACSDRAGTPPQPEGFVRPNEPTQAPPPRRWTRRAPPRRHRRARPWRSTRPARPPRKASQRVLPRSKNHRPRDVIGRRRLDPFEVAERPGDPQRAVGTTRGKPPLVERRVHHRDRPARRELPQPRRRGVRSDGPRQTRKSRLCPAPRLADARRDRLGRLSGLAMRPSRPA